MRYAEKNRILGSVLVGAMHTDLGMETEILSGYYNRPFDWAAIAHNQEWIIQFASIDDPWIPIEEPRYIHEQLNSEYYEFADRGHFGGDRIVLEFPELVAAVKKRLT
jgi:hypothetical protein